MEHVLLWNHSPQNSRTTKCNCFYLKQTSQPLCSQMSVILPRGHCSNHFWNPSLQSAIPKKLSSTKPVPGAWKVGNRWLRCLSHRQTEPCEDSNFISLLLQPQGVAPALQHSRNSIKKLLNKCKSLFAKITSICKGPRFVTLHKRNSWHVSRAYCGPSTGLSIRPLSFDP